MKKTLLMLSMSLFLVSCATTKLQNGLNGMMGSHERLLFEKIGYPDNSQKFGNDTVYSWSNRFSSGMFMPSSNSTQGMVGRTPFMATTATTQFVPIEGSCEIQVVVSETGYIKNYNFYGNGFGCMRYADAF
ncbi:MAG: hypothetical protein HQM06_17150 [Magnetococcales bacterium]|nr:hypothetical protein [Magnetococcales bacterium]